MALYECLFPSSPNGINIYFYKMCVFFFDPTVPGHSQLSPVSAGLFFQVFEFHWLIFGVILPYAGNKRGDVVV
jgi:hypothetical protein